MELRRGGGWLPTEVASLTCWNVQPEFFCSRRRQLAISGSLLFEVGFQLWIIFRSRHALKVEGVFQILGKHFHELTGLKYFR
jgi:hypothetical protein